MKITKYLKPIQISIEIPAKDKTEAIGSLVKILVEQGLVPTDKVEDVIDALIERESLTSTGLGYGVALPHVKTDVVKQTCIAFGRSNKGIDFDALDGNPVNFFFLILAPVKTTDEYLKILSAISALMKNEKVRSKLMSAQSADEIYKVLNQTV